MSEANNVIEFTSVKERRDGIAYIEQMYSYYDEKYTYNGRLYEDVDIDLLDIED